KLKEGWQPFGSPVAITPYTLMQAITAEGDVMVSGATEPDWVLRHRTGRAVQCHGLR
ncbi:PF08410 domain protein, partial [Escherichia coli 97.0246]